MSGDTRGWKENAPPYLAYGRWHEGTPIAASVDRQWLWRLESALALGPQNDAIRSVRLDLKQYLGETCEHEWSEQVDYDDHPLRQCRWCYLTEWQQADGSYL